MNTSRMVVIPTLRRTLVTSSLGRLQAKRPNFQRSFSHVAKSGSEWTLNELKSYNIDLQQQDALKFFGVHKLPKPAVDPEILKVHYADSMKQDRHVELWALFELATGVWDHKMAISIVDFAVDLFKYIGYVRGARVACTRLDLQFHTCGEERRALADVCLLDSTCNDVVLVVREDQGGGEPVNAQAQLVAAAVAAFTENNANRLDSERDPLSEKVMPGIVMAGETPTFFKIPVSKTLATHIRRGTSPPDVTSVTFCRPPPPPEPKNLWERDGPLDNRRQMFSCYEAFKTVMEIGISK